MVLFLIRSSSKGVVAFRSSSCSLSTTKSRSTRLPAIGNLFEDLQRSFSTAINPMKASGGTKPFYTVGITGATGLVGSALRDELSRQSNINGKPVRTVCLNRGSRAEEMNEEESGSDIAVTWNTKGTSPDEIVHPSVVDQLDTIVHLSGENVATGEGPLGFLGIRPWTPSKKAEIMNSRVQLTSALSQVAASKRINLFTASGVGVYGSDFVGSEKEAVDESADTSETSGFLADVSRAWESATIKAKESGSRVVNMRFGVVLSTKGGALAKLYPIFFLGGGGIVGSGQQFWSFISARDIARAIVHCMETPSLKGAVNLCAPKPCSGSEFTLALGKALNRPTLLPFPGFAVSLLFGEMGEEMLLGGVRAVPTKLVQSGFEFKHPTIDEAIASAIDEDI